MNKRLTREGDYRCRPRQLAALEISLMLGTQQRFEADRREMKGHKLVLRRVRLTFRDQGFSPLPQITQVEVIAAISLLEP